MPAGKQLVNNLRLEFVLSAIIVGSMGGLRKSTQVRIEGMSCLNCAVQVMRKVSALPGVHWIGVSLGQATIEHDNVPPEHLLQAIRAAGNYKGRIVTATTREPGFAALAAKHRLKGSLVAAAGKASVSNAAAVSPVSGWA